MQATQSLPPAVQNLPIFVEYQLSKEFILFQKKSFSHVYVSPSCGSAFEWFGVMFIHRGLYQGAIIRFTVKISAQYPNSEVPTIVMFPIPKHPLVNSQTGQLSMSDQFQNWNSSNSFIFEVIQFAKTMFEIETIEDLKAFFPDLEVDGQCWTQEEIGKFNQQAVRMTHPDKHFINFNRPESLDDRKLSQLKRKLLTTSDNSTREDIRLGNHYNRPYASTTSLSGLSWTKKLILN